eukprot:333048_1
MKVLLVLILFSVYLCISVNPFDLTNKNGDIIVGQYLVFFNTACLAETNYDVIDEFLALFTCYNFNTKLVDLYPDIGDYFIVVNKDELCDYNDNTQIEFPYFCINSIEQDAWGTVDSSECACTSRNVNPSVFYNLDSLTPHIDNGIEFVQCISGYDPGFDIIVMDSGIDATHEEFDNIVYQRIFDAYPGDKKLYFHGTHVAGIIVGQNYGVFRAQNTKVKLLDVRVIDSSPSVNMCDFTNGYKAIIDYLQNNPQRNAIINFSIRWDNSEIFDKLLALMRQNGGIMFASAGNKAVQSCLQSPSSSSDTFSVGSLDKNFDQSWFSNYGACVNIWAPGENITSAYVGGGSYSVTGTSMAAPLVAGVAANILMTNPQFNVDDIRRKLLSLFNGAEYDVNFDRPDIDPEYKIFPQYTAPVLNQPRVQGSCKLYMYDSYAYNGHNNDRYAYNGNDAYGYNNDRYAYKGNDAHGYNNDRYAYNSEYKNNRYGYREYGYNRYQKNEYEGKGYKKKGYWKKGGNNEKHRG